MKHNSNKAGSEHFAREYVPTFLQSTGFKSVEPDPCGYVLLA